MSPSVTRISFVQACAFESLLLGVAALLAWIFQYSLLDDFHWNPTHAAIGLGGIIPIALLFLWLLQYSPQWFSPTREFLDETLRPFFEGWNTLQLACLSLIAGVAEEFLFRGAIQAPLMAFAGTWIALGIASALFGLVHLISVQYAVVTAIVGVYLGLLFVWTDNLLTPVVTHAGYDFFALVYYLKLRNSPPKP